MDHLYKKLFRSFFLIILLLTNSCGFGIFTYYKSESDSIFIPRVIRKNGELIKWDNPNKHYQDYTTQEVIDKIGNPNKRWREDDYEYLLYSTGELRFSGIVGVVVIIPFPLVIPIGIKSKTLVFKNNLFQKTVSIDTKSRLSGCGMEAQKMEMDCSLWKELY